MRTHHRALLVLLMFSGIVLSVCSSAAVAQDAPPAEVNRKALVLTSAPTKPDGRLLFGEPLFVRVQLVNNSAKPVEIGIPEWLRLADKEWRLEVAEGEDGPFRRVKLHTVISDRKYLAKVTYLTLKPGAKREDYLTIWFAADGDLPGERRLVFRRKGRYRYRITFSLRVGPAGARHESFTTTGAVRVSSCRKGGAPLVKGLREIMFDNTRVPFDERDELEVMLKDEELKGTPYAAYGKWMLLRSYMRDGKGPKDQAVRAKLLADLAADILKDSDRKDQPPIRRDALLAQCRALLLTKGKEEARKALDQIDADFPWIRDVYKLRSSLRTREEREAELKRMGLPGVTPYW
jgi:hypothetical protein